MLNQTLNRNPLNSHKNLNSHKKSARTALRVLLMGCLFPLPCIAQQIAPNPENAINRQVASEGVVANYQSRLTSDQIQAIESRYPADVLGCNVCRQRLGLPLLPENSPLVISSSHNVQPTNPPPANAQPIQAGTVQALPVGPTNSQLPLNGFPRAIGGFLDSNQVQESAPLRSLTPNANAAMQRAAQQRLQSQALPQSPAPLSGTLQPQTQTSPSSTIQSAPHARGTAVPLDSLPPEIRRQIQGTLEIPSGGRLLKPGESIPSPISTAPTPTAPTPTAPSSTAPSSTAPSSTAPSSTAPAPTAPAPTAPAPTTQPNPVSPAPASQQIEELPKRTEAPELALPPPSPMIKPVSIEIPLANNKSDDNVAELPVDSTLNESSKGEEALAEISSEGGSGSDEPKKLLAKSGEVKSDEVQVATTKSFAVIEVSEPPEKESEAQVITVHVTADGMEKSKANNQENAAQLERVQAILGQHQMQIAELKEMMNRLIQREAPRGQEPHRNPDMERHIDRQAQEIRELQGQLEKMRDVERENRNLREKLERVHGELRGIDESKEQLEHQKIKLSESKRQLLDERKKLERERKELESNRPKLHAPVERKIEQVPPRPNLKDMKLKEHKPKKPKKDSGKEASDERTDA